MSSDTVLSELLQSCASITKKSLSLLTLAADGVALEDLDAAIYHEYEIAQWLDRQTLDYSNGDGVTPAVQGLPQNVVMTESKKTQQQQQQHDQQTTTTMTTSSDLLEKTWNQNLHHLLLERIKMAASARDALQDGGEFATLTREGLASRDALADQVTTLQNQVVELQGELETITRQCRTLQGENRHLWNDVRAVLDGKAAIRQEDSKLVERNWVLKRVLADLIVGTDSIYRDERIADTFLKLEH